MSVIQTPCRTICVLDPAARLCRGCGRSVAEISRWREMSAAERTRIMALLPARLETLAAPGSGARTAQ